MAKSGVILVAALLACGLRPASAQMPAEPPAQTAPQPARGGGQAFRDRFEAANTTHDGRLTLEQAQAAHMVVVVRHFAEVDTAHRGYITLRDIRAYRQQMRGRPGGPPADIQ